MIKRQSGLLVPDALAEPKPERRVVSYYRWNKMTKPEQDAARDMGYLPPMAGGAAKTYALYNGTQPTTAALVKVATGTSVKTLMQIQTASSKGFRVIEWGISFDAVLTTACQCELIDTAAVAATVTTYASTDIVSMNGPNDEGSLITRGTSASGFTATSEGVTTVGRLGDYQLVTQQYFKQFPLGREFEVPVSHNLRVRITSPTAVNANCYVSWEE
jgi:hypothetical protein